MTIGEKENRLFEYYLHSYDCYQETLRNKMELRYQLPLIFIPTIVGLWGFIGLIITSDFITRENPFLFGIIAYAGLICTFLLILMWRHRAFDLFKEELRVHNTILKFEDEIRNVTHTPIKDISKRYYLKNVKTIFRQYYVDLYSKIDVFDEDDETFRLKLLGEDAGLNDMDKKSQIFIGFLSSIFFISSLYYYTQIIHTINADNWGACVVLLFFSTIIPTIFFYQNIQNLRNNLKLEEDDIRKYLGLE